MPRRPAKSLIYCQATRPERDPRVTAHSLASASIMTELVKGRYFKEAKEIMSAFLNMIKNTSKIQSNYLDEDQKIKLMSLSGVKQFPMRVKCATLSWHTLASALEGKREDVNTEALD